RRLRPRSDRQPALEHGTFGRADDRIEVIPRPEAVEAELVGSNAGLEKGRPIGVLVPAERPEPYRGGGFGWHPRTLADLLSERRSAAGRSAVRGLAGGGLRGDPPERLRDGRSSGRPPRQPSEGVPALGRPDRIRRGGQ